LHLDLKTKRVAMMHLPLVNIFDFLGEVDTELVAAPSQQVMVDIEESHDFVLVQEVSVIVEESGEQWNREVPREKKKRPTTWMQALTNMGPRRRVFAHS
jgi:hypothetical protein